MAFREEQIGRARLILGDCRSPLQREHGQHENRWNGECDARCGVAAEAGAKEAAGGGLA